MNIRKATMEDAEKIARISDQYSFETDRDYKKIIGSENKGVFIIEENGQIAGFLGFAFDDWNSTARVINILVSPNYRHNGFGSKLAQYLIQIIPKEKYRTILAEAPSKSFAPQLYLKNGFRKCGYNDRYYDNTGKEIAEFYSYDLK